MESADAPLEMCGPIDQASIEFKMIFDSLVGQGFTEAQSLYMVAAQITGNPGIAPGAVAPDPPTR